MYCKLFASLYQGTLRGASHEILVFTNLLAHAGRDGVVDKHFRAIAEETGLTVDQVKAAILVLESPDPESRSPEASGARIIRMDEHRVWGWKIVNYGKYRAIRSEEDRAEQNRLAQERWRNKNKPPSAKVSHDKPLSAQGEGEGDAEGYKDVGANGSHPASKKSLTDLEWVKTLASDKTYLGIDVEREYGKMLNWCSTNKKSPTRRRFTNWINRAEKPMSGEAKSRSFPKDKPIDPSKIDLPSQFKSWAIETYPEQRESIAGWKTWADVSSVIRKHWWGEQENKLAIQ